MQRKKRTDSIFKGLKEQQKTPQKIQQSCKGQHPLSFQVKIPKILQPKFISHLNQLTSKIHDLETRFYKEQYASISSLKEGSSSCQSNKGIKNSGKIRIKKRSSSKFSDTSNTNTKRSSLRGSIIQKKSSKCQPSQRYQMTNGSVFQGVLEGAFFKKGKLTMPNGVIYIGQFENNMFHGKGTMIMPDQRQFECNWVKNEMDSKGIIRYPNGQKYEGGIVNLKKQGNGILYIQQDVKYVGQFKNGEISGFGTYYKNNEKLAEGYWKDGSLKHNQMI